MGLLDLSFFFKPRLLFLLHFLFGRHGFLSNVDLELFSLELPLKGFWLEFGPSGRLDLLRWGFEKNLPLFLSQRGLSNFRS